MCLLALPVNFHQHLSHYPQMWGELLRPKNQFKAHQQSLKLIANSVDPVSYECHFSIAIKNTMTIF
jgi:hypothetical protein